ncbi:MAG: MerR family transcriptional regulator [Treponema sp.]|nr:MerR family transcriptional regulator [Treponema sp.]
MSSLIKIKDMSNKYDITARTLRYYEDMGLLTSTRSDDYGYRMYDEEAVKRLEQILILRKLNISIKDIQRIFGAAGSEVVLEVLQKKVKNIDDEVALLNELKEIVLDFIRKIERMNFTDNSDIKLLYDKAKEIETQLVSVDYIGKPSNINRLIEITDKLDKKIPDVMIVRLPKFKAVTTGYGDFGMVFDSGIDKWQEEHRDLLKDIIFSCPDFLMGGGTKSGDGVQWIWAVKDCVSEADTVPYKIIEFEGGLYASAVCIDNDNESIEKVHSKILQWIKSTNFEHNAERDFMGHMTYIDDEIKKGLGYEQLQRYVPIKLKDGN